MNWVPVLAQSNSGDTAAAMMSLVCTLGFVVVYLAALWRIFSKAGRPGWLALIPIVNTFVMVDIAGKDWWWVILFFIPVVNIVAAVVVLHGLSESFGHGLGFTLGLIFLSPIFILLLAFGGSQYQGPNSGRKLKAYV